MLRLLLITAAGLGLLACAHAPLDRRAEAQRLLDTDKAFAALSLEQGAEAAFRRFFATNGVQLAPQGEPARGNEAVAARLKGDFILDWFPQEAEVSAADDMGWTWGRYELRPAKNAPVVSVGTYLDVWIKQADGSWRIRIENGNQAKPAS
ncbi:MAG: nuclear transport factor 2 family protein [Gammaproteobacteria bacterium]|nr:nuclear transport factor 2 family protein [Gammaproteobacteria bacterium]